MLLTDRLFLLKSVLSEDIFSRQLFLFLRRFCPCSRDIFRLNTADKPLISLVFTFQFVATNKTPFLATQINQPVQQRRMKNESACLCYSCSDCISRSSVSAQSTNWHFGANSGVTLQSGAPVYLGGGMHNSS